MDRPELTNQDLLEYISLRKLTPETVRLIARVNARIDGDEELHRRVAALEWISDTLEGPPAERSAFLSAAVQGYVRQRQKQTEQ